MYVDPKSTDPHQVTCGAPQGSFFGPILFTLYTVDVGNIIHAHRLLHLCYADEKQVLGSCKLYEREAIKASVLECIQSVATWMTSSWLKLDLAVWIYAVHDCRQLQVFKDSELKMFHLTDGNVEAVSSLRNISMFFELSLMINDYISRQVSAFSSLAD